MRFKMVITILGILVGHGLAITTTDGALCAKLAQKPEEGNYVKALLLTVLKASSTGLDSLRGDIRRDLNSVKEEIFTKISKLNQTLNPPSPDLTDPYGCANMPNGNSPADTTMILSQRNVTHVNTTQGLHKALRDSVDGTVIQLAEGVYPGPFSIPGDDITLRGQGAGTILSLDINGDDRFDRKVALQILGADCQLHTLKIVSSHEHTTGIQIMGHGVNVSEVQIEGFNPAVETYYNDNTFTNISVRNGHRGFTIAGKRSQLTNIRFENMAEEAVTITGDNNSVNHMSCLKCSGTEGVIRIEGSSNRVQQGEMRDSKSDDIGIFINKGAGNVVDFFRSGGNSLYLNSGSTNSIIRNSAFSSAQIHGSGHTLFNVDAGSYLLIRGSGVRIEQSRAEELINMGTNVSFIQSDFD